MPDPSSFNQEGAVVQLKSRTLTALAAVQVHAGQRADLIRRALMIVSIAVVLFLALYNLTDYPTTWFDEGSHLHVPKTLVRFGVYADYSSEGFRYYGPTIGVGPTVMLPIAAVFRLFGIGLFQARLVMAVYLLATIWAFYGLARTLGGHSAGIRGRRLAWVATALLVTSRGVSFLLFGRQVLGEVPGLFFVVAGLWLWFSRWEKSDWGRLVLVGLLLGLAMITKYQYLLFLGPTLVFAWLANLVYYRVAPHRVFVVPGLVAGACFGLWQLYMILYLGPGTAMENLAQLRQFTAGAALNFSPSMMEEGFKVLMSFPNYLGSLLPGLIYGFFLGLPRRREGQLWAVLYALVAVNLVWYVGASIGWWRYAFLGLAMAALFVARLFHDLTGGFRLSGLIQKEEAQRIDDVRRSWSAVSHRGLRWAMVAWLAAMFFIPVAESTWEILSPDFNAPDAMASYMNEHVPQDALIETWEPEMGFLTDHNYHFPPALLLLDAVEQAFLDGPPVSQAYHFVQSEHPDYVLVGYFSRMVDIYPLDLLEENYELVTTIGSYDLYARENGTASP
jgi:4-amino-4-deoxy-L-arabinose transferase-like glycosyltransferase